MLWLGLYFPRLPLEVVQARASAVGQADWLAVCDPQHVLDAGRAARADGIRPGMRRATALALSTSVHLVDRDPEAEHAALVGLALCALPFSPTLSLVIAGPQRLDTGLLLEVAPSLRLFQGLPALVTRLRKALAGQGISLQMARASTPTAAWLLARGGQDGAPCEAPGTALDEASGGPPSAVLGEPMDDRHGELLRLPIALLESARGREAALSAIGVRTIAAFEALPRAGLARRYGAALITELDRAFGRRPDPRALFEAPRTFSARLEWLGGVGQVESLLIAGQRLLDQLVAWLAATHAGIRVCCFTLEHEAGPPSRLLLQTSDPTRDPRRLLTLLREKLGAHRLSAPVQALMLACSDPQPLAAPTLDLISEPGQSPEELGRLIERLRARLGDEQVLRLHLVDDHRPEAAFRLRAEDGASARPSTGTASDPIRVGTDLPRPLWLFTEPIALSERDHRPWWRGSLHLLVGPERIETGWWDGGLIQRDYFIAEDDTHQWYWIYRERLPDPDSGPGWFLQGRFG